MTDPFATTTASTTPVPPPPTPKPKAPATDLEKFLSAADSLSAEDRAALMGLGIIMPLDVSPEMIEGKPKYGYICKRCNGWALYFVGKEFTQPDGSKGATPPYNLPMQQIPFVQPALETSRVNHFKPICQHCYQPVETKFGSLRKERIKEIEPWEFKRDKAMEAMRNMSKKSSPPPEGWKPGSQDSGDFKERRQDLVTSHFPEADKMTPYQEQLRAEVMASTGDDIAGQPYRNLAEGDFMRSVLNADTLKGKLPNTPSGGERAPGVAPR